MTTGSGEGEVKVKDKIARERDDMFKQTCHRYRFITCFSLETTSLQPHKILSSFAFHPVFSFVSSPLPTLMPSSTPPCSS
jgi:hypothetical protein